METQTIINIVFAVAFVGYVVSQPNPSPRRVERNPTFDTITCKSWDVVDADGKKRITAFTDPDGTASVQFLDKDEKARIAAGTFAVGYASVQFLDKDEKTRIAAATYADGTVALPTKDLEPPNKP